MKRWRSLCFKAIAYIDDGICVERSATEAVDASPYLGMVRFAGGYHLRIW